MVAFGSILRTRFNFVHALDDVSLTSIKVVGGEPLRTAALKSLEKVQPLVILIFGHPFREVGTVHARLGVHIGVIRMVINDWHVIEIVYVVFVRGPVVVQLFSVFVGTIGRHWKIPGATILPVIEEVVFFISVNTHPGWIISPVAAVVDRKIWEVIVQSGVRSAVPWFIFSFWIDSALIIGTI